MRFLTNENIPLASVLALRDSGHDVISATEICPGDPDEKVMQLAHEDNRVIVTFDRDYGALVFQRRLPLPPGILLLRFRAVSPREPAYFVTRLLSLGMELNGNFTSADRNRVRQRPLVSAQG